MGYHRPMARGRRLAIALGLSACTSGVAIEPSDRSCPPIGPAASATVAGPTAQASASASVSGGAGGAGGSSSDPRVLDYGEALRTASLKLVGEVPDLGDLIALRDAAAADKPLVYQKLVDGMLADARFGRQMIAYWRDVFR